MKNAALHKGYLPYTANNVLRGAFKYYNAPYSWGGAHKGIDDASFIANVYRTMAYFCRAMPMSRKILPVLPLNLPE